MGGNGQAPRWLRGMPTWPADLALPKFLVQSPGRGFWSYLPSPRLFSYPCYPTSSLLLVCSILPTRECSPDPASQMAKIAAIKGISSTYSKYKPPGHPTSRKRVHKREHAWVDLSDDDLEVNSSRESSSRGSSKFDQLPRKKARLSTPPALSGPSLKESLQQQRKQLPIYSGTSAPYVTSSLSLSSKFMVVICRQGHHRRRHPSKRCHCSHWRDWFRQDNP